VVIVSEELRQKILGYLATVSKAKNRDVARAIGEEKRLVDKAIAELSKEGKIEYIFLDTSYVTLKGKEQG
jgi:Mn-dependent DtxR family transcriptional regulator